MTSFSGKVSTGIKTLIFAALSMTALLLLVFGPRAGEELPRDCVIVDYWEKWSGTKEAGIREIVDEFNTTVGRDKHIYVRCLSTSMVIEKTLVSTAAGAPPDVAGLYKQKNPPLPAMDAPEPLDEMAAARAITADTYKKVFWDECHFEGRL